MKKQVSNDKSGGNQLTYAIWLALIAVVIVMLIGYNSPELHTDFPQPFKYKLVCFGADLSTYLGLFLEYTGLSHRINVTRFAYYWVLGAFNIRDPSDGILITDEKIEHVPIRIYRPPLEANRTLYPTILFFHGGGYFVGSADNLEPITYLMAKHTGCMVIYVEFRLIPEHKYPAALVDSLLVTRYLLERNKDYLIDLNNLVVMGDSAGGNLAAVITHKLSEQRLIRPKLQVLIYPILQFFDFTLPSYEKNLPKRVLGNIDKENFKNFIHYFTGVEVGDELFQNGHTSAEHKESVLSDYLHRGMDARSRNFAAKNDTNGKYRKLTQILLSPECSPLLVDDAYLNAHTPENNFLLTTGMDILRDDGFIYAHRLRSLGKNIKHAHYEHLFHGVFGLLHGPLRFNVADNLVETVAKTVKEILN